MIKAIATHPNRDKMTLLIDVHDLSDEEADLALSSLIMNLMIEEELELDEGIEINLISQLSDIQWSVLLSQLQGRVALENENIDFISVVKASQIPTYKLANLVALN
jgi:hypothetical protein